MDELRSLDIPWWIGGSRALERFTAVRRPHPDTDVGIFRDDLPVFVATFPAVERVSHDRLKFGSFDIWLHDTVFPPDPSVVLPLDDVTFTSDGVRYLRPEYVLVYKAAQKTTTDLESTLPWLHADARARLVTLLDRVHPGHPWLDLISS
ncbi:hypothetical protein Lesp02_77360 [Lentzea sp. NBRC 105346]|uniref:hypothetical protein n=1 Tax=Lentzea sp. NBRC 105346 TaxID=3032205 RepID=UPI0024A2A6D7|nr:hypothetical protein [Lentzea sp. NBRC 105346]GLZ35549.1 hypothetical protein Lesp02_77360 [Lentzea sp. NBRC 105346]